MVQIGEKNKVVWFNKDPQYNTLVQDVKENFIAEAFQANNLADHFRMKKYPISSNATKSYLTLSELKCLQHHGQGYTHKEIGKILQLSYRTVETHLRNIRNKLDLSSNKQLLEAYHSSALANLYEI